MNGFGRYIAVLRRSRKLSLSDVAAQLGVGERHVGHWEAGRARVPLMYLQKLAALVGRDPGFLTELWNDHERQRKPRYSPLRWLPRGQSHISRYPIRGSVKQMLAMHTRAALIHESACARLTLAQQLHIRYCIPRDSPLELGSTYALIGGGAVPERRSLLDIKWPYAALDRITGRVINHLPVDMLVLRLPACQLIAVPQVTLMSVTQSYTPRLDYLALYSTEKNHVWLDIEIDGRGAHDGRKEQDERRARGLGLVRVGYGYSHVFGDDFVDRVLADAHRVLVDRPPQPEEEL